jgi:selenocysteine lyase/cysteine desulfurase
VHYWISDAHKWLFSPKGSAVLWVTREKQSRIVPSALGAVVRSAASMASFRPAAVEGLSDFELRFQYTGTRDYTPLVRTLMSHERVDQVDSHGRWKGPCLQTNPNATW